MSHEGRMNTAEAICKKIINDATTIIRRRAYSDFIFCVRFGGRRLNIIFYIRVSEGSASPTAGPYLRESVGEISGADAFASGALVQILPITAGVAFSASKVDATQFGIFSPIIII